MTARQRGQSWQADFSIQGRRYRRDFDTKQEAEAWERDTRETVKAGRTEALVKQVRDIKMEELKRKAHQRFWQGTKSELGSVRNAEAAVAYFGASTPASQVTAAWIDDWISGLQDEGKANGTINRKLAALKRMLRFAHRMEYIERVPHIEMLKENGGRMYVLDEQEEASVLGLARQWGYEEEADLLEFLILQGCRLGEALKLTDRDIAVTPKGGHVTFGDTKNGDDRMVPLRARAQEIVAPRVRRGGKLFNTTIWRAENVWARIRAHMGIDRKDFVIHALRHTCISRWVAAGIPLPMVQKLAGHKTIITTRRYTHFSQTQLDGFMAQLDQTEAPADHLRVVK
ncbi:tyrosine-type recombinase/integrase [Marinibaculum pumilum]|uniref:Tyrosine-type recombinase/integrase n=1 Tax=Marinibaculum pumilum TaxID=1766165 RepID=A0ABV7L4K4_9PROT